MRFLKLSPVAWILLAGISAALHIGKLPTALPVLQESLSVSLVQSGFLVSMVQLGGVLLGLPIGLSIERWGLRRSLLAGLALLAVASLLGGAGRSATALLVFRGLEGVGFLLTVLPVPGLLRQLVEPRRLNRTLGLWSCYMGLGVALALLLGPLVIDWLGWSGLWWGLTLWTLLVLGGVLSSIPADRRAQQAGSATAEAWYVRMRLTLSAPGPWLVALCFSLYTSQWMSVVGFLPSIYHQQGMVAAQVGLLTAMVAAANVVGNLGAGLLMHRGVAAFKLLIAGFAGTALCTMVAFGQLTQDWPTVRFLAILLFSALGGLIPGALFALAVQLAPAERLVSTTIGWMQQWSSFGSFAGPPLVGYVAAQAGGWHWTWGLTVSASILGILLAMQVVRVSVRR